MYRSTAFLFSVVGWGWFAFMRAGGCGAGIVGDWAEFGYGQVQSYIRGYELVKC